MTTMQGEPQIRRKFVMVEPDRNSNKEWLVEVWANGGGQVAMKTTWGRVGQAPQSKVKQVWPADVDALIREKQRKGYREIQLARPKLIPGPTGGGPVEPKVAQLIGWIFQEAGEAIHKYLDVPVDNLSEQQIAEGRQWLKEAERLYNQWNRKRDQATIDALAHAVREFYTRVPTKLPAKVDRDTMVYHFTKNMSDYATRLDQLEAAVATLVAPGTTQYDALGADITLVPSSDALCGRLVDYVTSSAGDHFSPKVQSVYAVTIPDERERFKACQFGKSNVRCLFHGTKGRNIRHILKQGLRLPTVAANGALLGSGIYFANCSTKSGQYSSVSTRGAPEMLLLADVALGSIYVAKGCESYLAAPAGHDSVMGKAKHTASWGGTLKYDEFVVYRPEQATIRYIVTFTR